MDWAATATDLIALQQELAAATPDPWQPGIEPPHIGGCFVCFGRGGDGPGAPGDRGWAAASILQRGELIAAASASGRTPAGYEAGLLALREGPLLESAVRALPFLPDVLLVNATGRDHPRRAGLALHLGAVLDIPTVGVTHRTLVGHGNWPEDATGATSPIELDGEIAGYWVRTRAGTRPLVAHAAWRASASTAATVLLLACRGARTPEPIREARRVAREARAADHA
jgi:deoxyribonuclease V